MSKPKKILTRTEMLLKLRETIPNPDNLIPVNGHTPVWRKSTYEIGDGDRENHYTPRAGSCHKYLKSFGVLT